MIKAKYFIIVAGLLTVSLGYFYFTQPTKQQLNSENLYLDHCSSCHGSNGKGGIGLPLNSSKLATQLSDDYLRATIALGRSGRVMPPFKDVLSLSEIDAIVEYMRRWQNNPTQRVSYSSASFKGDFAKGETIYLKKCARCHGDNMEGDEEGTGITLSRERKSEVAAPALSNPGFLKSASDEMLLNVIYNGREDSPMPAFKDKGFTKAQLTDVVFYLRKRGTMLSVQWDIKQQQGKEPIFALYESPYDFDTTKKNIYQSIKAMNFRAYKPRLLEEGLREKSLGTDKNKQVFRFCNFQMLSGFLKIESRLGVFLPCNVTVIKRPDGKVLVSVPNLRRIVPMFNNKLLNDRATEVEELLTDLIEEALL